MSGYVEPEVLMTRTSSCFEVCVAILDKICPMEASTSAWLTVVKTSEEDSVEARVKPSREHGAYYQLSLKFLISSL